jgi:hypothetical protein
MVAALSLNGYEAVHIVLGSIDGEEFLHFIIKNVVHYSICSISSFLLL